MPSGVPSSLDNWWCPPSEEYGFVGFSYEVTACQDVNTLRREFMDIRETFKGRYVRMYGFCDRAGFYDDIVTAAWDARLGVHALIWFGFDGGNEWQTRKNHLVSSLYSNPRAKFITRVVQFGSEPLYDRVLTPQALAQEVVSLKRQLGSLGIPVTISDMAYSYQENGGAKVVLDAIDMIDGHMLPFFSYQASTASKSWHIVQSDLDWFIANGQGKKIYLSENGWPSVTSQGVQPNSPNAVSNVDNERDYYTLLDSHCWYFKNVGVGWFAHIYSDNQEPGYGIYDVNGRAKFWFRPQTSC
ncbi:glycoside hydrolase superfamily [Mucidula mucida]|nr:glycoside hydrolase superfamily [Mucidula mucida]